MKYLNFIFLFILLGGVSSSPRLFAQIVPSLPRKLGVYVAGKLQYNRRMRNIGNILTHHKKLVIESKLPLDPLKSAARNEQKSAKSRSSEFNIHRAISKGKCDPAAKVEPRQSQSTQNYLKLKLENDSEQVRSKSRYSLQRTLFEPAKNGLAHDRDSAAVSLGSFVSQILTLMQEHSELTATSEESIVVSKERLKEVFVEVLMWVVQRHMRQRLPRCNCRELNALLSKLVEEVERQLRERGSQHLDIHSGVSSCSWDAEEFTAELETTQRKLDGLTLECSTLEQRIADLVAFEQSLQEECRTAQQLLLQRMRQQQAARIRTHQSEEQLSQVGARIEAAESRVTTMLREQQSIRNYSSQQRTHQVLRLISEDYRRIESDIYEYAVYLQSNQLANDLSFEPHPFRDIEQQLEQAERALEVALGREEGQGRLAANFVEEAMGAFRRKDREMRGLLEFRTKCVRQFVEHMKKWLSNWELKQEFLSNLRKEFAADAALLLQAIDRVAARGTEEAEEIRQTAEKMIENYKMGNSFY